MSELLIHGDYAKVLNSTVDSNIAEILPDKTSWGIGLGAPNDIANPASVMGEAIFCGGTGVFLPAEEKIGVRYSTAPFTSGFFSTWDVKDPVAYYSAPGTGWSVRVLFEQMYEELCYQRSSPGIYGVVMCGVFSSVDCQVLAKSPIESNRPNDHGLINASSNYPGFFRKQLGMYRNHSFVAAGLIFVPDKLSLFSGSQYSQYILGKIHNKGDFHFHLHSVIFDKSMKCSAAQVESVNEIAQSVSENASRILTCEHLLPDTEVYEARCFLVPIRSIKKLKVK